MAIKLGAPKENQSRSLTKKEKSILKTTRSTLVVSGTKDGFQIFDSTGKIFSIDDSARVRLTYFWGAPTTYVWGTSKASV